VPGKYTFPRQERLTRREDFRTVFDCGERRGGSAFICYVARRVGLGRKFGFAVSRKIGGAVVRNRIKRYLREIYRMHRTQLPEDVQVVVVARAESASLSYDQCRHAIRQLLCKAGVLGG
jgi:ribonuclease P protein component